VKGVFEMYASKGNHIITCTTEHKAVLDACKHIEKQGGSVTYLEVQADGLIDLAELEAAINDKTILIAIMYGNNEIGVVQPVREISQIARKHGVLFFTDATQAVGKIPVDVLTDGIDLMSFSGHKMYGPKGVGALYVRRKNPRVKVTSQMDGGGHERGMRSGTLNVPGIVGLGKACEISLHEMESEAKRLSVMRDRLENSLLELEEAYVNGNREHRLPHTSNISFKYVEGEGLMMGFNKNIALSSGSACTSASLEPSYVLKALGLGDDLAHSSLRFGLGRFTTDEQIDFTIDAIKTTVLKLREMSPLWEMHKEGIDLNSIEWAHH
jgi:cysteine desulfurase